MYDFLHFTAPPESRRMSRIEKSAKVDLERDSSHKVDTIREDEIPVLDLPSATGEEDKTPGDGTDGEMNEEKTEGDKTEDGDKAKEENNKERKIWMEYADFCKCFRLEKSLAKFNHFCLLLQ